MTRPVLVMLLSRHPFAEQSGRATMIGQRIEQARAAFDVRLVVFGAPAGDARDDDIEFLPLASPLSLALNALRLGALPLQTWLYHSSNARRRVAAIVAESKANGIYIDMLRLAPLAEDVPRRVARIIDYDDLLSRRYSAAAQGDYDVMGFLSQRVGLLAPVARTFASPLLAAESARCARYEREMLARADLVLLTSAREAETLHSPSTAIMAAPPLAARYPDGGEPGVRLIFLGNLHYGENIRMLRVLADSAARRPQTDWIIEVVGAHPPELPAQFDGNRFRFVGRLDDLGKLAGAGIFLAPVVGGSGVKLKILDGLALGCPVVTTPKGCEGLGVRPNRDLMVVRDADAVLGAALALRSRPRLSAMLARRGLRYVRAAHGAQMGEAVTRALREAVARAGAGQDTL